MNNLRKAAQAVLDRWNSPQWEWASHGPTADLMQDLRYALEQPQGEPMSDDLIERMRARSALSLAEQRVLIGWIKEALDVLSTLDYDDGVADLIVAGERLVAATREGRGQSAAPPLEDEQP